MNTRITAPFDGLMGRHLVDPGNVVGGAAQPTSLATIDRTDPLYVYFTIDERDLLRIAAVGINPTRVGFLAVLERMGARPRVESPITEFGEPVGDLVVAPAPLQSAEVAAVASYRARSGQTDRR